MKLFTVNKLYFLSIRFVPNLREETCLFAAIHPLLNKPTTICMCHFYTHFYTAPTQNGSIYWTFGLFKVNVTLTRSSRSQKRTTDGSGWFEALIDD